MSTHFSWNHRAGKGLGKGWERTGKGLGRAEGAGMGLGWGWEEMCPSWLLHPWDGAAPKGSTGTAVPLLWEFSEVLLHPSVSHSPTAYHSMETRSFTGKNFTLNLCFFTKRMNGIL